MSKVIVARGFNDEEYEAIKKELKEALDFRFTVRRRKPYYQIDIRPTKKQGYEFTNEQIDKIFDFLVKRGNIIIHGEYIHEKYENRYLYFRDGFTSVMQLAHEDKKENKKSSPAVSKKQIQSEKITMVFDKQEHKALKSAICVELKDLPEPFVFPKMMFTREQWKVVVDILEKHLNSQMPVSFEDAERLGVVQYVRKKILDVIGG